ncbi:MAG TPA: multiprotein-bridging factor 1 family protein [archaeon]|nr:multiprotein-bridging factor 1 family protein [archaeon]
MECELCGRNAQLTKAEIEGTILSVCDSCLRLGRQVEFTVEMPTKTKREIGTSSINPDFASMIKKARSSQNFSIDQLASKISEKVSVLDRVEKGMRPTDMLAKKLEKALKIKLLGFEE